MCLKGNRQTQREKKGDPQVPDVQIEVNRQKGINFKLLVLSS
jgi:hypothetical protein